MSTLNLQTHEPAQPAGHDESVPDETYFRLIRRFPLRKLRSEEEHRRAMEVWDEYARKPDEEVTEWESAYAGALAVLIEARERDTSRFGDRPPSPARMLKHLMGERDMPLSDLNAVLGRDAATLLDEIGPFPEADAQALADYFRVDIRLFV